MTTKARIFRAPKGSDRPYVSTRRETAQDKTLSWEARGMLWFFLSLQDGWEITIDDLMQKCGRDKAYRIIKELRKAHYMERERIRKPDGRFTWGDYQVHERPYTENQEMDQPLPENTEMGAGVPLPEKPYPVNTESNTHNTSIHKDQKTEPSEQESDPTPKVDEHHEVTPDESGSDTADAVQSGEESFSPVQEPDYMLEWKTRGYQLGQVAFWWYPDGNKFVPGKIIKLTKCFAFFESKNKHGESVTVQVGPNRCSVDGKTEGWITVAELIDLERLIAVESYGMTPDQQVSGDRLKEIRGHLKYIRTQFQNGHAVEYDEFNAAFGGHKAQGLTPPKRSAALADMINTHRAANQASAYRVMAPSTRRAPHEEADPNCPLCGGNGVVRANGAIVPCTCRERKAVAS